MQGRSSNENVASVTTQKIVEDQAMQASSVVNKIDMTVSPPGM